MGEPDYASKARADSMPLTVGACRCDQSRGVIV